MLCHRVFVLAISASLAILLVPPVAGHPGGGAPVTASCTILAPLQTSCSTGTHTLTSMMTIGVGGLVFVGEVTNAITWSGGSAAIRCSVIALPLLSTCAPEGAPPPPGTSFEHVCTVEALVVAAVGQITCTLGHN